MLFILGERTELHANNLHSFQLIIITKQAQPQELEI